MELPAQLTVNDIPVTVMAIYPDDGVTGSITFDTPTDTARGVVFLTSQNNKTVDEIEEQDVIDALETVL